MGQQIIPGHHKPVVFLNKCPTIKHLITELQELQKIDPSAKDWFGDPDGDIIVEGSTTNYIIQTIEDPELI